MKNRLSSLILALSLMMSLVASHAQARAVATGVGNQWNLRYGNRGYAWYLDSFVRGCQAQINNNEYLERATVHGGVVARAGIYAVTRLESYRINSSNFTACNEQ